MELSSDIWNTEDSSLARKPFPSARPDTPVGVIDRAAAVMDAVEAGARSFTDIVRVTGLTRPTAHRLIRSLEDHGYLIHVGGLGYALGPRLLALATAAMRELPLRELAHGSRAPRAHHRRERPAVHPRRRSTHLRRCRRLRT
jgi:biotin operon repressor